MKQNLKVVRLKTNSARGWTARETLMDAMRVAKKIDAESAIVILRSKDSEIHARCGGCDWVERTGMLEIAKGCDW